MSTAYTLDTSIARAPLRRVSASLGPTAAEGSRSYLKAIARIVVISTAAVTLVAALHQIHIDNPPTTDRRCTLSANSHNSLVRVGVPPLAVARDWHIDGLPVLREPTGTDGTTGSGCDLV